MLYSTTFCQFFKLFTTVAITFHSITLVENTSLDVKFVNKLPQLAISCIYLFFVCWNVFIVVDVIHQSGTVNYKISLDKIVGIFPNKNTYV